MYQDFLATKSDVVLSPFAGIGSELYVALQMGRRAVGAELKESYWRQAVKNCHDAEQTAKNGSLLDLMQTSEAAE